MTARQLHLNAFLMGVGHHEAAWRLPQVDPGAALDVAHYQGLAQTAERGLMDSVFFADSPSLMNAPGRRPAGVLDPTLVLTAMAVSTERVGLIATASTTYEEPFNLARRFASLDQISGGRAGWNIVTTAALDAGANFGYAESPSHADRYDRGAEFVDVVRQLWDSWADDAILADQAAGVFADADRVLPIDHVGRHFRVRGPLNVPRSVQGHPVLVQAGSSSAGRAMAARYAEAVFTAQTTLEDGQLFYADLKARARALGRREDSIKILPGLVPVIGSTVEEARALDRRLADLLVPRYALVQLAASLGVDPDSLELDAPLPDVVPDPSTIEGNRTRYELTIQLAERGSLTVRQLIEKLGGGRGHRTFAGTPEQVADTIELWFREGAADGFNIMPAVLPDGLDAFVEQVVPILQRRGLFRREYAGTTLREHYGLAVPPGRVVAPVSAVG